MQEQEEERLYSRAKSRLRRKSIAENDILEDIDTKSTGDMTYSSKLLKEQQEGDSEKNFRKFFRKNCSARFLSFDVGELLVAGVIGDEGVREMPWGRIRGHTCRWAGPRFCGSTCIGGIMACVSCRSTRTKESDRKVKL